jgi:hypothetical protein
MRSIRSTRLGRRNWGHREATGAKVATFFSHSRGRVNVSWNPPQTITFALGRPESCHLCHRNKPNPSISLKLQGKLVKNPVATLR